MTQETHGSEIEAPQTEPDGQEDLAAAFLQEEEEKRSGEKGSTEGAQPDPFSQEEGAGDLGHCHVGAQGEGREGRVPDPFSLPADPFAPNAVPRAADPSKPGIRRLMIRHEQIINWYLLNPHRRDRDCAAFFGVSQAWLSTIKASDAFKTRMRQRVDEMGADVREEFLQRMSLGTLKRLEMAADIAIDRLTEKLEGATDPEFLLDATDKLCHRLGFAPSKTSPVTAPTTVTNNTLNINVSAGDLASAREMLRQNVQATAMQEFPKATAMQELEAPEAEINSPEGSV